MNILISFVQKQGFTVKYQLTAVVVHKGESADEGHYVTYAHTKDGWFKFDDSQVC